MVDLMLGQTEALADATWEAWAPRCRKLAGGILVLTGGTRLRQSMKQAPMDYGNRCEETVC